MSRDKTNTNKPNLSFRDLQDKIEDCKNKRDDLNKKTKDYIKRLQEIDNEIVEYLKIAKSIYKKKRDYWNLKVGKLKEKKIEYKDLLDKFTGEKKLYLRKKGIDRGNKHLVSLKTVERKIENLERSIETDALDMEEENGKDQKDE